MLGSPCYCDLLAGDICGVCAGTVALDTCTGELGCDCHECQAEADDRERYEAGLSALQVRAPRRDLGSELVTGALVALAILALLLVSGCTPAGARGEIQEPPHQQSQEPAPKAPCPCDRCVGEGC